MRLMTKELEAMFAKTGSQEHLVLNAKIIAKFFNPCGAATWWTTEYDPKTRCFFGFATLGDPQDAELGSVSLDELHSVRVFGGLGIERDVHYKPGVHTLAEVMAEVKGGTPESWLAEFGAKATLADDLDAAESVEA